MRAGGKVDCNAVICVADGMCAEETCGSGSGGEAHRDPSQVASRYLADEAASKRLIRGVAASDELLVQREDGGKDRQDEETSFHEQRKKPLG